MVASLFLLSCLLISSAFADGNKQRLSNQQWAAVESFENEDGSTTVTYHSRGMKLLPGEVAYTDPDYTPVEFPKGFQYAIRRINADVVDDKNQSVPLSQVYLHHWVFYDNGNAGPCEDLAYTFGVGAESRRVLADFPAPYGYVVRGDETWSANIHIIDTRYVSPENHKHCIECHCPGGGGTLACCPDGHFCETTPHPADLYNTYYLRYTLTYVPLTPDVVPLEVYVVDVSDCRIDYNVSQCKGESPCINVTSIEYQVPEDGHIVYVQGHIHIGSQNITTSYFNKTHDEENLCVTIPTYGSGGNTPGNETGFLVDVSVCTFDPPFVLKAGSYLRAAAAYYSDPYRDGVMGYSYIAAVNTSAVTELKETGRLHLRSTYMTAENKHLYMMR